MDHETPETPVELVDTPERQEGRYKTLMEVFPALSLEQAKLVDAASLKTASDIMDIVANRISAFNKTNTHDEHGTCIHVPHTWGLLMMLEANLGAAREQLEQKLAGHFLEQLFAESGMAVMTLGPDGVSVGGLDSLLRGVFGEPQQPFGDAKSNEGETKH
jgi:hypothetical protein